MLLAQADALTLYDLLLPPSKFADTLTLCFCLPQNEGGSSRALGHLPGNHKVPGSMPLCNFATVASLGKKLYSHCPGHPAVKPGKYCACIDQGTAEEHPL